MSDVHNTPAAATESVEKTDVPDFVTPAEEPTAAAVEPTIAVEEPKTETSTAALPAVAEPATTDAAPTEESKTDAVVPEKTVEPISEGLLGYKGHGLIQSLIPSKKEFWLSDEAVAPTHLDLYLRGEKPEIAHPIAAWASQTGKGLLFFNKKGDTDRTHPADILALYDATDLKKESPHQFSFKISGHAHTFKAINDVERDGWYQSIEKSIELAKATKEDVLGSEGYKSELEKLNKSSTSVAGAKRSQSQPKKSTELDKSAVAAPVVGAGAGAAVAADSEETSDKKQKSRSQSRGILNRFKSKKDETDAKAAGDEEVKPETTEVSADAPVVALAPVPATGATAALDGPAVADHVVSAPVEEQAATEPAAESAAVADAKTEEKPKPSKRGSIFGKLPASWGSIKSPAKEKDQKEAELKSETAKDTEVTETAPQLPEATVVSPAAAATTEDVPVPAVEEPAVEKTDAAKEEPAAATSAEAAPTKEKGSFLSGLGFKRNRSVSPSTQLKESAKKEETVAPTVEPVAEETAEPAVAVPATTETAATEASPETTAAAAVEKPEEKTEENSAETFNKRQSVLGSLGRRASKAFNRIGAPKKEANASTTATEATKAEPTEAATETKATEEVPAVTGETTTTEPEVPASIGDVVPEAVNVGKPQEAAPAVAASA